MKEIIINNLLDGIFYAKLICIKDDEIFEIDSRTSDAIAMAVRFECPIYTYDFIMSDAGVVLDDPLEEEATPKKKAPPKKLKHFKEYSVKALKKLLEQALAKEDYEKAAKIRDEIQRKEESTE